MIGVGKKCFYFSNDTRDWAASKRFCQSQGSELARVDTQTDMVRKGESLFIVSYVPFAQRENKNTANARGQCLSDTVLIIALIKTSLSSVREVALKLALF